MNLVRLLRTNLDRYRWAIVLVVVLQGAQTTATLLLPALSARLIDDGVLVGDRDTIWRVGAIMLAVSLVQVVFAAGAMWFGANVAMGFGREVRGSIFRRVTEFSAREISHFGAPSLITRITNDVQQVQLVIVMTATMMIAAPLTMVIGTVLAVREDAGLSIVLFVAIPIEIVVLGFIIVRMTPAFQQMQTRIDRVNTVLREQIAGVRVVRAFTREPEESARFGTANRELTAVSMRAARLMSATFPTVTLIVNLASVAVLWIGADMVSSGDTEIGSLIAYLSYLAQIMMAVVLATFMISMIPRAAVAAERILDVVDTRPSVVPPATPVHDMTEPGTVELRDAGLRYPGAEHAVLEHVSVKVRAGETLAIIGSTGAGKSTLVALVARLMDATDGDVLVGGVDVRELAPEVLWRSIGYVPQRSFLFAGTVASNLRFARPDATDRQLWDALEIAQASSFVQALPDGLDSTIAQGGGNLSGGQRQRLAIARALVAQPLIFLFDDSFSALDLATEARLRVALAPHTRHAAVLVVAQRISSIEHADQILVLEDGEVVGLGRHAELLLTCPIYAEINASQNIQAGAA
jgi:ATP-binding cassette, subfamily B, multidrug efflux pump